MNTTVSEKTVERLSLYRRILQRLASEGEKNIFSHQLSTITGGTAAQVRQDMRVVGYSGSPSKGYNIEELIKGINVFFWGTGCHSAALVGVGNMGRALLAFFSNRDPNVEIVAAFDNDTSKINRVIHGCRCYPIEELKSAIREKHICTGIITVPANNAQRVANLLVEGGIVGILNFAPVRIKVPAGVFVDYIDLSMAFEKVAFFANQKLMEKSAE